MDNPKVIIIGGGFGGLYTAKYLDKLSHNKDIDITIINKNNFFLFTPLLHEVATGGLSASSVVEPIREVFRGTNVRTVEGTVILIDDKKKFVQTENTTFYYDYLVVSSGADTNYYNVPGAQENSFTLKNLQDAIAIRNHLIETCEIAVRTKNKDLLNIAVVGGGPTGVELVAELSEYIEHTLCSYYKDSGFNMSDLKLTIITSAADLISQFPEKMRRMAHRTLSRKKINILTNTTVKAVESSMLLLDHNRTVRAHTIIWVAGVCPSMSNIKGLNNLFHITEKNRLEVNDYLQSTKNISVFSLGDVSGKYPMLGQVAVQQAKTLAHNICAMIYNDEKQLPYDMGFKNFKYKQKGLLLSVGQWYAIGDFGIFTLSGRMMWLLWRFVYLLNFISWRKKYEIAFEWIINFFYPRDISYLK